MLEHMALWSKSLWGFFIASEALGVSLKVQEPFPIQSDPQNQMSVMDEIHIRVKPRVSGASSLKRMP